MTPEQFDSIKGKWPFKNIEVGQVKPVERTHGLTTAEIQSRCHSYGCNTGKKFSTTVVDGVVWVKRIS